MPLGFDNRTCEFWLLDMDVVNPTVDDLTRIAAVPRGAEITGAVQVDENTILVNSQHPSSANPFPYNHSLTVAISGFAGKVATALVDDVEDGSGFRVYPNPVSENLFFDEVMKEVTVLDMTGKVISTKENANSINFSNWAKGIYIVKATNQLGAVQSKKIVKN